MSIEHKTLRDEILFVLGRATSPLDSGEIFERAKLADYTEQVSKALWALKDDEKIVRVLGDGRARYTLAEGQRAPAPAGKAGRSQAVKADERPTELPTRDLPPLDDLGHGLNGAVGKTQRANPEIDVPNLANAMLEVSRDQLSSCAAYARRALDQTMPIQPMPSPRWSINQDGGLEIGVPDQLDLLVLSREQAQRMAAMVLGAHDALERA